MYKIPIDTHVHTSTFSDHAQCTYGQFWEKAAEIGLKGIGVTGHIHNDVSGKTDAERFIFSNSYFLCQNLIQRKKHGVKLYRGAEIDIAKKDGTLCGGNIKNDFFDFNGSLVDLILSQLDYAIASAHHYTMDKEILSISASEGTRMYINAMQHPKIFVLGHIGRGGIPYELCEVVKAVKELGKTIEINEGDSLKTPDDVRKIAEYCAETGTMISIGSDSHAFDRFNSSLFSSTLAILEEISFPLELIVNRDIESFEKFIRFKEQSENKNV